MILSYEWCINICDVVALTQEAFKAPVIQVNSSRLILRDAIPDLLFADLPPELLLRTTVSSPEQYLLSLEDYFKGGGSPTDNETGLHLRSYYTSRDADICVSKPAGASKTVRTIRVCVYMCSISMHMHRSQKGQGGASAPLV